MSSNESLLAKAPYITNKKVKLDKQINEEVIYLAKERLKQKRTES